jgi:hypothetical protein
LPNTGSFPTLTDYSIVSQPINGTVPQSSQQLVSNLPSSPNPVTYRVTQVSAGPPPTIPPVAVQTQIQAVTDPIYSSPQYSCSSGFTWNGTSCTRSVPVTCK